jgi:type I restriction enzyme R subunit
MYDTRFSTKDKQFYNYYKDIAKRIKEREKTSFQDKNRVDILLVVNMFLTGFDAKKVNTLYVDKNLKHHGLIQAFSRTNRTLGDTKSFGNIVCFRNLKQATDDAVALFSNTDAKETIFTEPYEIYVKQFDKAFEQLKNITPTADSVNELADENEELKFVQAFRALMRLKNSLSNFADFKFEDIGMDAQEFEDYKSKYLDIHKKVRKATDKEKVSILNDVDFELELIHSDEINVAYILQLLQQLYGTDDEEEKAKQRKKILDTLGGDTQLHSKKELIEKFIDENLPNIQDIDNISEEFLAFWNLERLKALHALCEEEQMLKEKIYQVIENYLFTGREPLRDDIISSLKKKPSVLRRKKIGERIIGKILDFVEVFDNGV